MSNRPYALLSVLGIEIEYMLVDKQSLSVQAKSDVLLSALSNGQPVNEVSMGPIAISNELVLHVLEFKNNGPKKPNEPIVEHFQQAIETIQPLLLEHHLCLLPSGAHPWMKPDVETQRWPHGNRAIYQQYDTIFNCKGHGWANLQSMHVNLPFANDEEFCALHNTTRLLLPLLPALAASTPFLDGKPTGMLDSRLSFYELNQRKIPSISGQVIPEYIVSEAEYEQQILKPMYEDIKPYDPEGILQEEWLNSRAAIPKFDYGALEIRIIDSQECVRADIAIAKVAHAILKSWCEEGYYPKPPAIETSALKAIYDEAIQQGFNTAVTDTHILKAWKLPARTMSLKDAWTQLIEKVSASLSQDEQRILEHILRHGNLSERILKACNNDYAHVSLHQVYQRLAHCLLNNQLLTP